MRSEGREAGSTVRNAPATDVRLDAVDVGLDGVPIVHGVSMHIPDGSIAGVVGPNGSGKSTLLRTLYRHLRPSSGSIVVGEEDLWELPARENAKRVAAVPQERPTEFDFTVREVVAMGRLPHLGPFAIGSSQRTAQVEDAMRQTGLSDLATRLFATLSGGERQRVLLARALAQATPVLVLDEPTNHLDIKHQLEILELLRELGLTTVMAIHDLTLAATYCDTVHVLQEGRLVAAGPTREVLTPELIAEVFDVLCTRQIAPDGSLQLSFRPRPSDRT